MFKEWYKYLPTVIVGIIVMWDFKTWIDIIIFLSIFIIAQIYSQERIKKNV